MEDKIEMELIPTSELKIRCKRVSAHFNAKGGITATISDPDIDDLVKQLTAAQIWETIRHYPYQIMELIGEQYCIQYWQLRNQK